MKFPKIDHPLTGVAVPLSALRSQENAGIGEYPDLVALGRWCRDAGLELIQLLPVSDTGFESSPYSALSAYALHPVYLRLAGVTGADSQAAAIQALGQKYKQARRVPFQDLLRDKLDLLRLIFQARFAEWKASPELAAYVKANSWVPEYAVFCTLKHRNHLAGWQSWSEFRQPKKADIKKFWDAEANQAETLFFAWLQYECERQLKAAAEELTKLGVALKGDIPILINEDSADVWANPELFSLENRAGAPPDGASPEGQNWGFPTYRWENLAKDGYKWWKDRIKQADKFFHAYRIDHVLGFFRIWATPSANWSANLGHFQPSRPISAAELNAIGFDEGRITWMSEPHIDGQDLRGQLGAEADAAVQKALVRVGTEDLFKFQPKLRGEKDLAALDLSDHAKGRLNAWFRDRTLLRLDEGRFLPTWAYYATRAYATLGAQERWDFDKLIQNSLAESEVLWERQGRELMDFMKNTTDMLVCAEDLGSIPDCVPRVLEDQAILSLKIVRWARNWNHPGQPYYPLKRYPLLSVCTPSVHDTSTLRQWWYEEPEHRGFLEALEIWDDLHGEYTPELAKRLISQILQTSSVLCIFQAQDLFALDARHRTEDPEEERINWPGTVSEKNWTYKMKPSLEDLGSDKDFTQRLAALIQGRQNQALSV